MTTPPQNPAGPFEPIVAFDEQPKLKLIEEIRVAPANLRKAVSGLDDEQLDTQYRNWTIRQIAHHVADSHLNSLMRFKWALAEEHPTIKAYEEADWVELPDEKRGAVEPSLQLLDGLHAKWVQVLETMNETQYSRCFHHPQAGESMSLWHALNSYAWHGKHHTAQILWLRSTHNW